MADKLTPLILAALARAAVEPAGVPIGPSKKSPGLFANTAPAKAALKRCLDDGLLRKLDELTVAITDRGLGFLVESQNPKAVLEDLVRAFEERRGQLNELLEHVRLMAANLGGLQKTLAAVMPKVMSARLPVADLTAEILNSLEKHSAAAGEDCPLPELHRALPSKPALGAFHDALRKLSREGRVHLHPWTGPLYALPEPACALLVGHEVAYYASLKVPARMTALTV